MIPPHDIKWAVFKELELQGFSGNIVVPFAGSSDDGSPWLPEHVPGVDLTRVIGKFTTFGLTEEFTLHKAIDDYSSILLEEQHPGWEIGPGATGTITWIVPERRIKIEIHERFGTDEYY